MHLKDSSTDIFHHMDYLSLVQAFPATLYDKVKQCAICAKLIHDTDLVHTWRCLFYLSFIYCDYVLMPTQLSPHLHFICNQSPLLFALSIDLFKGIFLTGLRISDFVDKAEATLRNKFINSERREAPYRNCARGFCIHDFTLLYLYYK